MESDAEKDAAFIDAVEASLGSLVPKYLYDLARRGAAVQWRPISEAPRDGSWFISSKWVGHPDHPTAMWWLVKTQWSEKWNKFWDGLEPSGLASPTHFMPLPPHPSGGPRDE